MTKNIRAFRERTKRRRCPSCGKKGLTVARIVNGKLWRDCQYCGDSIMVAGAPTMKESTLSPSLVHAEDGMAHGSTTSTTGNKGSVE